MVIFAAFRYFVSQLCTTVYPSMVGEICGWRVHALHHRLVSTRFHSRPSNHTLVTQTGKLEVFETDVSPKMKIPSKAHHLTMAGQDRLT